MADFMRAARLEGPKHIDVVQLPKPEADENKVFIKISSCGICGSDIHFWEAGAGLRGIKGLIMGHELCGTVLDPGKWGDRFKVGDRVAALTYDPCGTCEYCRSGHPVMCQNQKSSPGVTGPGGYAEYFAFRGDMLRNVPDTIDDLEATMIEPSATTLHTIRLADINPGDTVLIVGAGVIGMLCAAWAKISGASYVAISEANAQRAQKARDLGDADEVFDATNEQLIPNLLAASRGGFTKAVDCSGSQGGINTAIMALRPQSRLIQLGLNFHPVPINLLFTCLKEIEYKGDLGYSPAEFDMAMDLMARKIFKASRFIDETIGLEGVQGAFECLSSGKDARVKFIIQP